MKLSATTITLILLVTLLLTCTCSKRVEQYALSMSPFKSNNNNGVSNPACALQGGVGVASALLPREVTSAENFGEFAPDQLLEGQSYLDPRAMIGAPETAGGALRNANQQIRSEPPNPRNPVSIFNTSTIVPDSMRANFEIGGGKRA